MEFPNLKKVFIFLGIENEYFGQCKTKNLKLDEYCKWHRINKHRLIIDEVYDTKKKLYKKIFMFSEEDLKDNFLFVYNHYGRIPTYTEFDITTQISINSYANILGLKGVVYDRIINKYVKDENILNEYYERRRKEKHKMSVENGKLSAVYTLDELKTNLISIFDYYINTYGSHPSRALFDTVSKFDSSIYRKRFKKSWTEIIREFGYNLNVSNKCEEICIKMCDEILGETSIRQKTFPWLKKESSNYLMRCDAYYQTLNIVIEFDGEQHRHPVKKYGGIEAFKAIQERDKIKENLLNLHNIFLIRIDSRSKWYEREWLSSYLKNQLSTTYNKTPA